MDYWLKGEQNRPGDPAVEYYLMGPVESGAWWNEWREAEAWPVPRDTTPYYLADEGIPSLARPAADDSLTNAYNPRNPASTEGGNNLLLQKGPYHQSDDVWVRSDVLVFTTEPLSQYVQVVGDVRVRLYVSSDRYDTDFAAKLVDLYPDGARMLVLDGLLMARHSLDRDDLLEPGEVCEIAVELGPVAYVFPRDHRIALAVSSSNYPRFRANPNVPEPLGQQTDTLLATNTVYIGPSCPSALILPVVEPQPAEELWVLSRGPEALLRSNPFPDRCQLSFWLGTPTHITVTVFDLLGRRVSDLYHGKGLRGTSRVIFGEGMSPGVYTVVVHAGGSKGAAKAVKMQ